MRILVLGGTVFVGPHVVENALARGHGVTIFHRGRHAWEPPPGVERVTGDRNRAEDLAALAARGPWDCVIDTCGYVPRHVRDATAALRTQAGAWAFVSSLSVYADTFASGGEDAPLAAPVPEETETVTGATYGPLKAACEDAARAAFGDRAMNVRPGLIVGPRDPTDRYTYWVRRMRRPGPLLAPGDGSRLVQFVDVRDLAAFLVTLAERGRGGTWNVTGEPLRFDAFLAGIAAEAGAAPDVRWIAEDVLLARGAQPWMEVPLWIGPQDQTTDIRRAKADGLTLRDPRETARDTLAWDASRDPAKPLAAGMTPEREAALLGG